MSGSTASDAAVDFQAEAGPGSGGRRAGRRGRRGRWVAAGVAVVAAGAIAADAAGAFGSGRAAPSSDSVPHTSTATVIQQTLTSQTQVNATLGNSGAYSLVNQATGTLTALPATGQVVAQGQVLYRVNGIPAVLLFGAVPAYRDLLEGATGPDVTELNADLVKLGYATKAQLSPTSDVFSFGTAVALEKLQAKLGVPVTGGLALGQAVFAPTAIQVTGLGQGALLGGPAQPGLAVLTATSTTPVVTIALDAGEQTEVKDGDHVSITLPTGQNTTGVVSRVSTVATAPPSTEGSTTTGSGNAGESGSATGSTGPTITVIVTPSDPKALGTLNQAPVEVTITTGSVANALVVPVAALLAQPGGGYTVEVVSSGKHHLVTVTPGLFDDALGLVQVTGTKLAPGQHVVVPA
jgi:Putative peptidoglycan binding domain